MVSTQRQCRKQKLDVDLTNTHFCSLLLLGSETISRILLHKEAVPGFPLEIVIDKDNDFLLFPAFFLSWFYTRWDGLSGWSCKHQVIRLPLAKICLMQAFSYSHRGNRRHLSISFVIGLLLSLYPADVSRRHIQGKLQKCYLDLCSAQLCCLNLPRAEDYHYPSRSLGLSDT